jgi:electron transfer flavoprotein beta subunit
MKPRINKAQTGVETTGMKFSLNPFDELSIEEAVRLRERKDSPVKVENILALSAGGAKCADTLRTAMAMGADRAFHVDVGEKDAGSGGPEPLTVAKMLKAVVEKENINLVLLGKQAIDGDQGQTGQMLAGLLGWPQATQASKVDVKDAEGTVEVTHEVDGGVETLRAKLPMVITTDLRLNEPRYASLPNIMKAKKKPLERKTLADFGVEDQRRLKTLKVTGECWLILILECVRADSCRTPGATGRRQGRGRGWPDLQAEGAWCPVREPLVNICLCMFTIRPSLL